ncbi:MAG TPA: pirin family protein [Methylibium sp.]|uniref:pirin family protein n=1 Tax=Methylibium sp. TaxID=2067992 RepID=UPI002DBF522D|nr:pirin family protein [Methylibium sp.]HEU4457591.1 pirin family protein [Methylibium sp.]
MITLRPAAERGHADHGWLQSAHSFSFADYHDPAHMGFGNLRVINDDVIAPGAGFGTHPHRDMEIVTYVLEGSLAHKDSLGNGAEILPGEVQRMSAGTGILHSEFNAEQSRRTHLLQIWILPEARGIAPGYEQKKFDDAEKRGVLKLVAAPDGLSQKHGAVTIHADAAIHAGLFDGDEAATLALDPKRLAYVHLARGELTANGRALKAGDALLLNGETELRLGQGRAAEVLVFDLKRLV